MHLLQLLFQNILSLDQEVPEACEHQVGSKGLLQGPLSPSARLSAGFKGRLVTGGLRPTPERSAGEVCAKRGGSQGCLKPRNLTQHFCNAGDALASLSGNPWD